MATNDNYLLNPIEGKHAQDLFELVNRNNEELGKYFPITTSNNDSIESSVNYVQKLKLKASNREMYVLGVFLDQELVGIVYIKSIDWRIPKCELGYFIDSVHQGKGVMSIVMGKTKQYCFEKLGMNKIFLRISTVNKASIRVAEKTGFVVEGKLRKDFKIDTGELVDIYYFGILKSEYRANT